MANDTKLLNATAKVFNTFELVEAILLNLCESASRDEEFSDLAKTVDIDSDAEDANDDQNFFFYDQHEARDLNDIHKCAHIEEVKALFRLQRVSITFRDVIGRSKGLRIAMLEEPECSSIPDIEKYTIFSPNSSTNEDCYTFEGYTHSSRLTKAAIERYVNPFVLDMFLDIFPDGGIWLGCGSVSVSLEKYVEIEVGVSHSELGQPSKSASWRDMLLTIKQVRGRMDLHGSYSRARHSIELDRGITLGDFVDEIAELLKAENRTLHEKFPQIPSDDGPFARARSLKARRRGDLEKSKRM